MNGWVLLHKKIWENPLFTGNAYATTVWLWLLTHADENGVVRCGRNQIAKDTGVKPPTVQYWLKRFLSENYQLAIIKTNNRFSEFRICKWEEYQRRTISKSSQKLSENYQQTITNKESKNKEKEDIDTNVSILVPTEKVDKRNPDVQTVIDHFEATMGLKMPRSMYQRRAAKTLISGKGGVEKVLKVIDAANACRDMQYAPKILSLEDLRDKWNDLAEFYRRLKATPNNSKGGVVQ
jgi:hypothetical protein